MLLLRKRANLRDRSSYAEERCTRESVNRGQREMYCIVSRLHMHVLAKSITGRLGVSVQSITVIHLSDDL